MSGARFWPVVERNPDDSFHDVERVHRRRIHRCRAADPCRVPGPLLRPHPVLPLAPRTARAVDLAVGERCGGPIFCDRIGGRLDRHDVARVVRRIARRAEIRKRVGPHTFVTRSSLQRSPPVSRLAMCKKLPATPIHRPRCATTVPGSHSTGTRPTSCLPSAPAHPASRNVRSALDRTSSEGVRRVSSCSVENSILRWGTVGHPHVTDGAEEQGDHTCES